MRPYCFWLYSVRLLALSCVLRVWLRLQTLEISLAMNSFVGTVVRLR